MDIAAWMENPGHTYIGGTVGDIPASKWQNPFALVDDASDNDEVMKKFEDHVTSSTELSADLGELRGKVLGCFCAPWACHGDVLNKLIGQ